MPNTPESGSSEISPAQQFKSVFLDVLGGSITPNDGRHDSELQSIASNAGDIEQRSSELAQSLQSITTESNPAQEELNRLSEMAAKVEGTGEELQALHNARIDLAKSVSNGPDAFSGEKIPPELQETLLASAGSAIKPLYDQYQESARILADLAAEISSANPSTEDYEAFVQERRQRAAPHIQNVQAYERAIEKYAQQVLN